jgi:hypothetical protein
MMLRALASCQPYMLEYSFGWIQQFVIHLKTVAIRCRRRLKLANQKMSSSLPQSFTLARSFMKGDIYTLARSFMKGDNYTLARSFMKGDNYNKRIHALHFFSSSKKSMEQLLSLLVSNVATSFLASKGHPQHEVTTNCQH